MGGRHILMHSDPLSTLIRVESARKRESMCVRERDADVCMCLYGQVEVLI